MVSKCSSESSDLDYIGDRCVWTSGLEFKCSTYSSTNTSIEGAKSHNFFVSQPISLKMVSKDSSKSGEHFVFGGLYHYGALFSSYWGFCVFYSSSRALECFVKYFWSRNSVLSEVNVLFQICDCARMFYRVFGVFWVRLVVKIRRKISKNSPVNSLFAFVLVVSGVRVHLEYINFDRCLHKRWWIYE